MHDTNNDRTALQVVTTSIFDRGGEERFPTKTAEKEAIAAARDGDGDAFVAILYAFASTLRRHVAMHRERLGDDEARAIAVMAIYEAVHEAEEDYLAGIVSQRIARAFSEHVSTEWRIPSRTQDRYRRIMRDHDGDVFAALAHCNAGGEDDEHRGAWMSAESFMDVHRALAAVDSYDAESPSGLSMLEAAIPLWQDPRDEDDRSKDAAMVWAALQSLDALSRDVVTHYFGFVTGDPMSDAQVVHALSVLALGEDRVANGETVISRQKVQRLRAAAIPTMRAAALAVIEEW